MLMTCFNLYTGTHGSPNNNLARILAMQSTCAKGSFVLPCLP